jgi:hypothetical protein
VVTFREAQATARLIIPALEALFETNSTWRAAPPPRPPADHRGDEDDPIAAFFRARIRELARALDEDPTLAQKIANQ